MDTTTAGLRERKTSWRHSEGGNYVFCDGRAVFNQGDRLFPHPPAPSTNYAVARPAAWLQGLGIASSLAYEHRVEAALDALADHLEAYLDIEALLAIARLRQTSNASAA